MKVTFIAHAGICIEEADTSILIDPWFTSSNFRTPILEGFLNQQAIDFQIPSGGAHVSQYARACGVFLSHFHTHHAPKKDLLDLVSLRKPEGVFIGYPSLKPEEDAALAHTFHQANPDVTLRGFHDKETFTLGSLTIEARTHTVPGHYAWHVKGATGSILHIADPYGNRNPDNVVLDELWDSFSHYKPDILFLNAGGNSLKGHSGDTPIIREQRCLTPGQAAMLTQKLEPKVVSLIGCYNRSLWNGTTEYARPSYIIEDEFYWGVRWVAPSVRCVFARPGHQYSIGEADLAAADTYIS